MNPVEWLPAGAGHYAIGRGGEQVKFLVQHHMDGTVDGTTAWFRNYAQNTSSTFGIGVGPSPRRVQWVDENDTPYANGLYLANQMSETFEWEDLGQDTVASGAFPYSDEQYVVGSAWNRERALERGIPIQRGSWIKQIPGIICHHDIINTYCPGTLDIDRIVKEARDVYPILKEKSQDPANEHAVHVGDVVQLNAAWQYADGRIWHMPTKKFIARVAGRTPRTYYPPIDPDADMTEEGGAVPAQFFIDAFPLP